MTISTYAWVNEGTVRQIIHTEQQLSSLYSSEFVAGCIDITAVSPQPEDGWSAEQTSSGWLFAAPVIPVNTLADQAGAALAAARTYVNNNYTMLNEATPDVWVTYLKALMAISNGTDTTSTALPAQPTDVMEASPSSATTTDTTGAASTDTTSTALPASPAQ